MFVIALLGSLVWTSVVLNGGQSAVISGNTNSGLDTHGADDRLTRHGSRSESQFTHRKSNDHHNLSQHKSMKLKVKRNSNYQETKDLDRVNNFFTISRKYTQIRSSSNHQNLTRAKRTQRKYLEFDDRGTKSRENENITEEPSKYGNEHKQDRYKEDSEDDYDEMQNAINEAIMGEEDDIIGQFGTESVDKDDTREENEMGKNTKEFKDKMIDNSKVNNNILNSAESYSHNEDNKNNLHQVRFNDRDGSDEFSSGMQKETNKENSGTSISVGSGEGETAFDHQKNETSNAGLHIEDFPKINKSRTQEILEQLDEASFSGESQDSLERLHQSNKSHRVHQNKVHTSSSKYGPWYPSPYPAWQPSMVKYVPKHHPDLRYHLHYVRNAEQKGALCLDGTRSGFYFRKGFKGGESKWIVYLEGGAWCSSKKSCYYRSTTNLGSSDKFRPIYRTSGLLSHVYKENPDFYNWNVAFVRYCDGASFAGNRSKPIKVKGKLIYFRGKRILSAVIDDLLEDGMEHAENVIFSGTSAGGLAAILHADYFRSRVPGNIPVYVLSDGGFFVDAPTIKGRHLFRHQMQRVCKLHKCSRGVNQECVTKMKRKDSWKCLFPQYLLPHVRSPLFIVNPLYDSWQLGNILKVGCVSRLENCSDDEQAAIKKYKQLTLEALNPIQSSSRVGLFADSCVLHGQVVYTLQWQNVRVKGQSMHSSFSSWIKNQGSRISLIDSDDYPDLNTSCLGQQ